MDYSWPGNVRELENSVEHAVVRSKRHVIEASDLPASLRTFESIVQPRDVPNLSENEKSFSRKSAFQKCLEYEKNSSTAWNRSQYTLFKTQEIPHSETDPAMTAQNVSPPYGLCLDSGHDNLP